MSEKVHIFDEDHKVGCFGARVVMTALSKHEDWEMEGPAETMLEQKKLGIDCTGRYLGDRGTIEIKADMESYRTRNLAIEIRSEYRSGMQTEGWMTSTTATYLVVLVTRRADLEDVMDGGEIDRIGTVFTFGVRDLRKFVPGWKVKYGVKRAKNLQYDTVICPVPTEVAIATPALLVDYGIAYRNNDGKLQATVQKRPNNGKPWTIEHTP